MYAAFNMGIGFCMICAEQDVELIISDIKSTGNESFILGKVTSKTPKSILVKELQLEGQGEIFVEI